MARHRKTQRKPRRLRKTVRTTTTKRTPRTTPHHHRPTIVKAPPSKFRVRLGKVEVVTGTELFERRVKGIKEGRERHFRRLGALGAKVSQSQVPKVPKRSVGKLPPGTKGKKKIDRVKVLVKARINGRLAYYTKTLSFKTPRTGQEARELADDWLNLISQTFAQSPRAKKRSGVLSFDVSFRKAA